MLIFILFIIITRNETILYIKTIFSVRKAAEGSKTLNLEILSDNLY